MLIDGEKYACEACVRGHRVSNCQHSDRPLQHINKKGRPVSQCAHCRTMRKSRSAHVKCDCGIKPNKCIHLQPRLDGHRHTCCCNHGGACTCACSSDDPTSTVGDVEPPPSRSKSTTARTRRASTVHSPPRSAITKPAHHKSTLRSRAATAHPRVTPLTTRRRSAGVLQGLSALQQDGRSGDTTPEDVTESGSPPPLESTTAPLPGDPLAPLDMSRVAAFQPYVQNVGYDLVSLGGGFSEGEAPLYSAGLAAPTGMWGAGELLMPQGYGSLPARDPMFDFDFAMAPDSYSEQSSDHMPTLAVGSSGEVSEADDNHSPVGLTALDAAEYLADGAGEYEGMIPQPEIFDDAPLYYTFDDEFQALGYTEGVQDAEKRPEYGYWGVPSP